MRFSRMSAILFLAIAGTAVAGPRVDAQGRTVYDWPGGVWPGDGKWYAENTFQFYKPWETKAPARNSALDEVNNLRARMGLRPFIFDGLLTQAAEACSQFRAQRGIQGHTTNDFTFLPPGGRCTATGCAAWEPRLGWGSCCVEGNYTYAGAGWTMGRDGKRYMHLFVR